MLDTNQLNSASHTAPHLTDRQRIQIIASRFPTLKHLPFVQQWDAVALDEWALIASHGERCAAQFVLSVWNQYDTPRCGKFDVIDAFGVWDQGHRMAFLAWAHNPVTC